MHGSGRPSGDRDANSRLSCSRNDGLLDPLENVFSFLSEVAERCPLKCTQLFSADRSAEATVEQARSNNGLFLFHFGF